MSTTIDITHLDKSALHKLIKEAQERYDQLHIQDLEERLNAPDLGIKCHSVSILDHLLITFVVSDLLLITFKIDHIGDLFLNKITTFHPQLELKIEDDPGWISKGICRELVARVKEVFEAQAGRVLACVALLHKNRDLICPG